MNDGCDACSELAEREHAMSSSFLIGRRGARQLWACIDQETLCTSPAVADRRFPAYLAPFTSDCVAREALLNAGAEPQSITNEIRPKRCRRG